MLHPHRRQPTSASGIALSIPHRVLCLCTGKNYRMEEEGGGRSNPQSAIGNMCPQSRYCGYTGTTCRHNVQCKHELLCFPPQARPLFPFLTSMLHAYYQCSQQYNAHGESIASEVKAALFSWLRTRGLFSLHRRYPQRTPGQPRVSFKITAASDLRSIRTSTTTQRRPTTSTRHVHRYRGSSK